MQKTSSLVTNLKRKRDLLAVGDLAHEDIRTALVICGGTMRGVFGAGVMNALHALGFADCFDVVVGISTGAATGGYFLAGLEQTRIGTSIYLEECLTDFIRYDRWPVVDIDLIGRLLRTGDKRLDVRAMMRQRSRFVVGVTNWNTGGGEFLDVKRATPDPVTAIKASLAVTTLYRKPVNVNDQPYTDGSTALPFPIQQVVKEFQPTDLLVVANCSQAYAHATTVSAIERAVARVQSVGLPSPLRFMLKQRHALRREGAAYLATCPKQVGVIWGPDSITKFTRNRDRLNAAREEGTQKTLAFFGEH